MKWTAKFVETISRKKNDTTGSLSADISSGEKVVYFALLIFSTFFWEKPVLIWKDYPRFVE